MNRITVGTASWTDKTLIASKKFYPRGCSSAEDRLRFYATQFPLVEVDSSYYAMHRNKVLHYLRDEIVKIRIAAVAASDVMAPQTPATPETDTS